MGGPDLFVLVSDYDLVSYLLGTVYSYRRGWLCKEFFGLLEGFFLLCCGFSVGLVGNQEFWLERMEFLRVSWQSLERMGFSGRFELEFGNSVFFEHVLGPVVLF